METGEHREVRRGPDGQLYQWSNASEKPSGTGWEHANKAKFPRVRSYLWFRHASFIQIDRENRRKREQAVLQTFKSKDIPTRLSAMFTPEYWLSKTPQAPMERMSKGSRVRFNDRVHYVKNDNGVAVDIEDAITGETKSVNHEDLDTEEAPPLRYAKGEMVNLSAGAIHPTKDIEGIIVGYDEDLQQYKVAVGSDDIDTVDPKTVIPVYPEAINAQVQKVKENIIELRQKLTKYPTSPFSEESKRVIDIVETASKNGRSTVSEKEVYDALVMTGQAVPKDKVAGTFALLKGYLPASDYNKDTGVLYIKNSKESLRYLRKEYEIPQSMPETLWKNLTGDNKNEQMIYTDQQVITKDGSFNGIVQKIEGKMVNLIDKTGKTFQTEMKNLLDFKSRKQVIMDPGNPKSFGKLNSDIFWIMRDREHCRDYKLGESVTLLPGLNVPGRKTTSFSTRHTGKIVGTLSDGTIRVKPDDGGGTWLVSPRQLIANKRFEDIGKFDTYTDHNRAACYDRSMFVNNVEVRIGAHPGAVGEKKITLTFHNGKSYSDNENTFFSLRELPGASFGGWRIPSLSAESGPSDSLIPSKTMTEVLARMYPNARKITIARSKEHSQQPIDLDTNVITVNLHIDSKDATGHEMEFDKLKELHSEPEGEAKFAASSMSPTYSIRMDLDEKHNYVSMRVGKDLANTKGSLPKLLAQRSLRDPATGKNKMFPTDSLFFHDVVTATTAEKQKAWGHLPNAEKLIEESSVFTYDPAIRRYRFDLGNYDQAHSFLRKFFGDEAYTRLMWETENGGWYARAEKQILKAKANKAMESFKNIQKSKENTANFAEEELDGFFIKLRKYQNAATHFTVSRDSSLLAMDQGTGKTFTAIADAVVRLNKWKSEDPTRKRKVLIIAPASVAQTSWLGSLQDAVWPSDEKMADIKNKNRKYSYTILMGENRTAEYKKLLDPNDPTTFAVTSYETFANSDYKELKDIGFDEVIIDEAQTIKNASDSAVISQKLKMAMADAEVRLALTGTPIENSPEDLQSILAWLDPDTFGDTDKFMQDFIETDIVEGHDAKGKKIKRAVGIDIKNRTALSQRLAGLMFRLEKFDLFKPLYSEQIEGEPNTVRVADAHRILERYNKMPDGPAKERLGLVSVIPDRDVFPKFKLQKNAAGKDVELVIADQNHTPEAMYIEDYPEYHRMVHMVKEQLRRDFMAMVERGQRPNYNVVFTRLQQVMNDPSLVADKLGPQYKIPVRNPKVDALIRHVEEHFPAGSFRPNDKNNKAIIFTYETKTVDFIEKVLTQRFPQLAGRILKFTGQGDEEGSTRAQLQAKFNKDKDFRYPIMIANAAARTGVDLPAANLVINYDIGWNPQDLNQRIDRAHRVRSIASIAKDVKRGLPPRNVRSVVLGVVSRDGGVNTTIESRKLATHWVKDNIFKALIKGEPTEKINLGDGDDAAARAEALLGTTNPKGIDRVDAGKQRRFAYQQAYNRAKRRDANGGGVSSWLRYLTG